ncbi:extracellular solute-binding protein [Fictibacillus fluitans]|uniref:Extracellular solute-binding protein n=1 Tax=Fictibacillus fluitans TaxID=3058422 RepID=A0ABT8HTJ0_9BACL|nr:extracellular solute-binding protein [Fictibacillus sp. NE201]MDN4524079.1 extracellular solute-binding protein [Fictibacillus sp. NE201]
MKLIKKAGLTIATVSLGLSVLSGCSDSAGSDSGKKVITVAYPNWWQKWLQDLEKDYEKENPKVDIKLQPLTANEGGISSKMAMMMKSKKTAPDVVLEDTFMIDADAKAGYLEPLDQKLQKWGDWDKFVDTTKKGITASDGKMYGVPFSTDVQGLWYNKKLLKKAGVTLPYEPKDWQEVMKTAQAVKKSSSNVIPLFLYASKATGESTSMRTFQVLHSGTGAELYDYDSKKWTVNQKAVEDSLGFVQQVFDKKLGESMSQAADGQAAQTLANGLMPDDKVAMVMDGNWVTASWREGGSKPWPKALDTWAFTAFPTQKGQDPKTTSMSGGWAMSVPKNSDEKDLAWKFIQMSTDKEHQLNYTKQTGDMTVRSDVQQEKDYLNQPLGVYKEAGEMLKKTNFRPAVDGYPSVSTLIQETVESVASGKKTPKQATADYINGLKRLVKEKNIEVQ